MSQSGKLMPNLDQQSTKVLNLTVLQRIDPFVEEILMTAAHVTFYEFNIELNQWSRKDVEGSLFVVKRNTQPRFQFIVMNRRNTDNLVEDLLGDFEYEVQVPYLLYRNAAQEVNGIWFYNAHDCEAIANLFGRILNAYSKVPPKPKASSKSSEFEELEAVPTSAVVEGPLEPPPTSSAAATVPDDSFVNFFSAATNIGSVSKPTIIGQPHQSSAAIPLSSHAPNIIPTTVPTLHSALSLPTSAPPLMPFLDAHESSSNTSRATNLVKPSFFAPASTSSSLMMPPVASSMPASPPLHPPVTMQRPYGTPLLQPFPPPTPSPSLTPPNYGSVITKDRVRDALLKLVQNNQFIDMVYQEMLNAHYS
ncbi:mRNA-decapping enzyme-like protein isoform X1 [Elaeis guineensis]|uniref:mRNA-decapping enzyme-like protein isoform X1 n=1 Tax=Elaeis guineensis var. tenera TaxID=51953 RepID=A0A6J0PEE6_ELAGV|nr:mRNA-decapping enzyme-like protein isoform X1 [Elaeis guineensis]